MLYSESQLPLGQYLNLCIKTEPFTVSAVATEYVWLLGQLFNLLTTLLISEHLLLYFFKGENMNFG